ncbi:MAG: hypothetical protein GY928_18265, partial [Colwellia sp.]|nr:hypothetical protein [Colwellia sp.]
STVVTTYVAKVLLEYTRSLGHIALPCASTGLESTNYKGGRTVHSRFNVPIKIYNTSVCKTFSADTKELIKDCKLIIWDEAPMQQKLIMECVDRSLQDLLENEQPFGGKVVLFCGDFRQCAPVIPGAGEAHVVSQSLSNSYLYRSIEQLNLQINERILQKKNISHSQREKLHKWSEFLLEIGDGRYPTTKGKVHIPNNLLFDNTRLISAFADEIYGNLNNIVDSEEPNMSILRNAIITPLNASVRQINDVMIENFPSVSDSNRNYKAINKVSDNAFCCQYRQEYLDSLKINGLPETLLKLKIGCPVMVMRNIAPLNGVCNGTKGIVTRLHAHVIELTILDSDDQPKTVFIHRISLEPTDAKIGIPFTRRQFPLKLAFAMTINKSQGQTLHNVGIYLPKPVFSHGQLYVALSRATDPNNIKIFINNTATQGYLDLDDSNVRKCWTVNEVYKAILSHNSQSVGNQSEDATIRFVEDEYETYATLDPEHVLDTSDDDIDVDTDNEYNWNFNNCFYDEQPRNNDEIYYGCDSSSEYNDDTNHWLFACVGSDEDEYFKYD